jgi:hypothetical protein
VCLDFLAPAPFVLGVFLTFLAIEKGKRPYLFILLISLGLAFWWRWQFVQRVNLYPDEFVTLLAMDMIGQKGVPVLPSGLFYEHGLLYSYLAGVVALWGEPALLGRLTSLVLGLATIVLTYWLGRRWFSPAVGILAAFGLALSPAAIQWSGRVRMYALLQLLVLLTLWFMSVSLYGRRPRAAWLAVLAYFGALLTQFVAIALLPALTIAEIIGLQTQSAKKAWYADPKFWLRGGAVGGAVLIALLLKRAGQPKGIEPLAAGNAFGGIWDVLHIYSSFSLDLAQSWQTIAPFFLDPPGVIFTCFVPVALVAAVIKQPRFGPVLFLTIALGLTTLVILLFAAPDRRDDKYLFMLLPVLLLLGAQGMMIVVNLAGRLSGQWVSRWSQVVPPLTPQRGEFRLKTPPSGGPGGEDSSRFFASTSAFLTTFQVGYRIVAVVVIVVGLWMYSRSEIAELLADVGENYATTFAYVAENWQPGDAILTGTPAAAYYYLGRNDYYAVQAGGLYDYRILYPPGGEPVERWLGSPWIQTPEALNAVLSQQPVWLVLERWGLLIQYYQPLFMQNILAQTKFIREDNGVIALKSLPNPRLLRETPAFPAEAVLGGTLGDPGQLKLLGYTLEGSRLTLYWEALIPVSFDYTVFVNVQNEAGETVLQTDHRPLGSIYPTTLWPPGVVIRETSQLDLPPGDYELRVGMYLLETGERLWVPGDETQQNMVYLGKFEVEPEP